MNLSSRRNIRPPMIRMYVRRCRVRRNSVRKDLESGLARTSSDRFKHVILQRCIAVRKIAKAFVEHFINEKAKLPLLMEHIWADFDFHGKLFVWAGRLALRVGKVAVICRIGSLAAHVAVKLDMRMRSSRALSHLRSSLQYSVMYFVTCPKRANVRSCQVNENSSG